MHEVSQHDRLRDIAAGISHGAKTRYLDDLSEDDFRENVIMPLFVRLGYVDGRDTCGPLEQGKDAYLTRENALAGTDVFVLQTKRGRISKGAKATNNLDNIVAQLRTALSTPVPLTNKKQRKLPLQAYLVASGAIHPAAQEYIVNQLGDPRLEFLDAETLIPQIDEVLPEIWLNISSDLMPYFRALLKAVETGVELLHGSINAGGNTNQAVLDEYYTNVMAFRTSGRQLPARRRKKQTVLPGMDAVPATSLATISDRFVLLVGEGGSGKSTAIKRIAYEVARRTINSQKDVLVPILVRARDVTLEPGTDLLDLMVSAVERLDATLKVPFSNEDLIHGRVAVFIDALDELTNEPSAKALMQMVTDFRSRYPLCRIILASRETKLLREEAESKGVPTYRLASLSLAQASAMISALGRVRGFVETDSREMLRRLQDIHGVELSPLIVTIYVATSDVTRSDIPANVTQLFAKYTELMLGKWDDSKGLHQQIQYPTKDFVLTRIAFAMHQERSGVIDLDRFRSIFLGELNSRGQSRDASALLDEVLIRSNLFRVENNRVEFKHLLLQEYFAGRGIPGDDFASSVLHDYWWRRALVFYFGQHPADITALRDAFGLYAVRTSEERFSSACTVGIALQACFLSPTDEKRDLFASIVETIARIRVSGDEFGKLFESFPFLRAVISYIYARESVSLSYLRSFAAELEQRFNGFDDLDLREEAQFWLLVGLIEADQFELVGGYLDRFDPRDPARYVCLHMSLGIARAYRTASPQVGRILDNLQAIIKGRIKPFRPELRKMFDNELLEFRSERLFRLNPGSPEGDTEVPADQNSRKGT